MSFCLPVLINTSLQGHFIHTSDSLTGTVRSMLDQTSVQARLTNVPGIYKHGREEKWSVWEQSWVHLHVNECADRSAAGRAWVVRLSYVSLSEDYTSPILPVWWAFKLLLFLNIKLNLTSVKMKLGSAAGGCRRTPLLMLPPCRLPSLPFSSIYSLCHIFFPPRLWHFSPRLLPFYFSGSNCGFSGGSPVQINTESELKPR